MAKKTWYPDLQQRGNQRGRFLLLWTGATTKWRNTQDWKYTEQYAHNNNIKVNQQKCSQHLCDVVQIAVCRLRYK